MSTYHRTAIRRLAVQGYRSLRDVVLEDLPDVVVLHGPNGAGKSNLLRAAQLLLEAVVVGHGFAFGSRGVISLPLPNVSTALGLRPDDFHFGSLPQIRVELSLDIGRRVFDPSLGIEFDEGPVRLDLHGVFQLFENTAIQFWFERANIGVIPPEGSADKLADRFVADGLADLRHEGKPSNVEGLRGQQLRFALGRILQSSDAYRHPGGDRDPQGALFDALLSEDPRQREAARRLGRRLAETKLFGAVSGDVALIPVDSRTYGEKQIRFRHPTHGEIPLRNLGSGEQQLVIMLAQNVITPFPISQIEEPEAHLHTSLMEPLARLLVQSVNPDNGSPDVDQLWIATHHHHFAIAPEFFDVSLDEKGATRVARKKRDLAVPHFYEPSPYWDTLRTLLESGMSPDTVVSLDEAGNPICAREVLASMAGDRRIANAFVNAATRAFVLSLTKEEPET